MIERHAAARANRHLQTQPAVLDHGPAHLNALLQAFCVGFALGEGASSNARHERQQGRPVVQFLGLLLVEYEHQQYYWDE